MKLIIPKHLACWMHIAVILYVGMWSFLESLWGYLSTIFSHLLMNERFWCTMTLTTIYSNTSMFFFITFAFIHSWSPLHFRHPTSRSTSHYHSPKRRRSKFISHTCKQRSHFPRRRSQFPSRKRSRSHSPRHSNSRHHSQSSRSQSSRSHRWDWYCMHCRTENLVQLQFNKLKPDSQIHTPAFVATLVCVLYFSTMNECTHT